MFLSAFGLNQHQERDLPNQDFESEIKAGVGWGVGAVRGAVGSKDRVREGRAGLNDKVGDPESLVDISTLALLKLALSLSERLVDF